MRPKRSAYNPMGLPEVTILEARVLEFGPVRAGQYRDATSILVPEAAAQPWPDQAALVE